VKMLQYPEAGTSAETLVASCLGSLDD
jgi:hypothetical protein